MRRPIQFGDSPRNRRMRCTTRSNFLAVSAAPSDTSGFLSLGFIAELERSGPAGLLERYQVVVFEVNAAHCQCANRGSRGQVWRTTVFARFDQKQRCACRNWARTLDSVAPAGQRGNTSYCN
jgi:hypothetical protein